jgi:hypothetical protein
MPRKILSPSFSARIAQPTRGSFLLCAVCLFVTTGFSSRAALAQEGRIEMRPPEIAHPESKPGEHGLSLKERRQRDLRGVLPTGMDGTLDAGWGVRRNGSMGNRLRLLDPLRSRKYHFPDEGFKPSPDRGPNRLIGLGADRQRPDYVRWVQESLNQIENAGLPTDGLLDDTTRNAIRQFQRKHGLVADGVVGRQTESKLEELTTSRPLSFDFRSALRNPVRLRGSSVWSRSLVGDALFGTPAESQTKRGMVFLDVRNRNGRVSVGLNSGTNYFGLMDAVGPGLAQQERHEVSSAAELEILLNGATTIVHSGDNLPDDWKEDLRSKGEYLRNSRFSPKQDIGQFVHAAQLLNRSAMPGRVKVLSALPDAKGYFSLRWQLSRMGLEVGEAPQWQDLQKNIDSVRADSKFQIESATSEDVIRELQQGDSDTVVLVAHYADGEFHFTDNSRLSHDRLSAIIRDHAPDRTVILISCEAGAVNGSTRSPSEILLNNKLAQNVLAHPEPISATEVPGMLRDFLVNGKTIKDSFSKLTPITENERPQLGPEAAGPSLLAS